LRLAVVSGKCFGELGLDFAVLGVAGEVGPLLGVALVIVEFFGSILVFDVAPAPVAYRMVHIAVGRDARPVPFAIGSIE